MVQLGVLLVEDFLVAEVEKRVYLAWEEAVKKKGETTFNMKFLHVLYSTEGGQGVEEGWLTIDLMSMERSSSSFVVE